MRLTIINQFYVPDISPTAHLSASLAEHRAARGDEVTVVASRGGYVPASRQQAVEDRSKNPRVHRIWTPQLGKATILRRLIDYGSFYVLAVWRLARLPRQDVIVSLTTPPFIAWAAALHKMIHRRTKLVLWNMDCYPEAAERSGKMRPNGMASRFMRFMNRALFRRLDCLICLDTAMKELLCSQYAPADRPFRATVIPNWEDAAFFPPDAQRQPWPKRQALGLDGKFVVLYLGNMGYGHSFETVIEAARALRDDPVMFVFVGGGTRKQWLKDAVAQHGLCNVVLHDYVAKDETPLILATADASLITLRDEVLGVMSPSKLHACLATGLPIVYIGPTKSNVDDAIAQFGCGVSLRHGQVDELVRFIRDLSRDRHRQQEYRRRARHAFDQAYCNTRTLPQFDAILDELGPGSGPAADAAFSLGHEVRNPPHAGNMREKGMAIETNHGCDPLQPGHPMQESPHSLRNRAARALWGLVYALLFWPSPRAFHRWRNWLLRLFGASLHPTARVYRRARCWAPWNLRMGAYACIADDVDVYNVAPIEIGDSSTVSQYSYLCAASHDFEDVRHPLTAAPITIGSHCWLAADVFVGPGVTIGDGTVVGARSSVFGDLEPWIVAAGTPARMVRRRTLGPADFLR